MQPQTGALGAWHEFYTLLGTASATMVGLLFVAATVGSGVFASDRRAALSVFLSASVVNFSIILVTSLIVLAPVQGWVSLGVMILCSGMAGLAHSCLAWRDTVRDSLFAKIDLEDPLWYIVLPVAGNVFLAASGVTLALRPGTGCAALALSTGMLLAVGIHNARDITVWSMTRRQQ
jgi:hypothetical protein